MRRSTAGSVPNRLFLRDCLTPSASPRFHEASGVGDAFLPALPDKMRVIRPGHGDHGNDQHERSEYDVLDGMAILMNSHLRRMFGVHIRCEDEQSEAQPRVGLLPARLYHSAVNSVRTLSVLYEEEQADKCRTYSPCTVQKDKNNAFHGNPLIFLRFFSVIIRQYSLG